MGGTRPHVSVRVRSLDGPRTGIVPLAAGPGIPEPTAGPRPGAQSEFRDPADHLRYGGAFYTMLRLPRQTHLMIPGVNRAEGARGGGAPPGRAPWISLKRLKCRNMPISFRALGDGLGDACGPLPPATDRRPVLGRIR